jgi:hypothetical protein
MGASGYEGGRGDIPLTKEASYFGQIYLSELSNLFVCSLVFDYRLGKSLAKLS